MLLDGGSAPRVTDLAKFRLEEESDPARSPKYVRGRSVARLAKPKSTILNDFRGLPNIPRMPRRP